MAVSIVTCWLDHPELIPEYEKAVVGAEVIIVDQASNADTATALAAMAARLGNGSKVIHLPENIHFAAGNNRGMAAATGDVIVCLNNDVVAHGPWLDRVAADVQPGGFYGPSVQPFDVDGRAYPYVEGWCIAAQRWTWGLLSPATSPEPWDAINYPRAYAEDVDLCWRARRTGAGLYQTRWPIRHIGNATNATLPGAYDHADEQRETFRRRVREWKAGQTA